MHSIFALHVIQREDDLGAFNAAVEKGNLKAVNWMLKKGTDLKDRDEVCRACTCE